MDSMPTVPLPDGWAWEHDWAAKDPVTGYFARGNSVDEVHEKVTRLVESREAIKLCRLTCNSMHLVLIELETAVMLLQDQEKKKNSCIQSYLVRELLSDLKNLAAAYQELAKTLGSLSADPHKENF